jgi:endonuclease G
MTPEKAVGCFPRVSRFQADPAIKGSGFSKFYSGSGYDIGHMANDSDMRWSAKAEQESNLFPNAAPQLPGLNRGSWKSLEVRTRSYSVGGRTLQVIMGAVVSPDDKRLGTGPSIPHAFWKALIDQKTNEVVAFSYPQAETPGSPTTFRKLLSEALKGTGVTVPLPKGAKEVALWPLTTSSITAKAGVCAIN